MLAFSMALGYGHVVDLMMMASLVPMMPKKSTNSRKCSLHSRKPQEKLRTCCLYICVCETTFKTLSPFLATAASCCRNFSNKINQKHNIM